MIELCPKSVTQPNKKKNVSDKNRKRISFRSRFSTAIIFMAVGLACGCGVSLQQTQLAFKKLSSLKTVYSSLMQKTQFFIPPKLSINHSNFPSTNSSSNQQLLEQKPQIKHLPYAEAPSESQANYGGDTRHSTASSKAIIDWQVLATQAFTALAESHNAALSASNTKYSSEPVYRLRADGLVLLPSLSIAQSFDWQSPATLTNSGTPDAVFNKSNEANADHLTESLSSAPNSTHHQSNTVRRVDVPAFLRAAQMYAAPKLTAEELQAQIDERTSIFAARRKGDWMGCGRSYYLVCKGVYRAIKRTNALTILDTACAANSYWLPFVIKHLYKELKLIKLTCADKDESHLRQARQAYRDIDHVQFTQFNPYTTQISNKTDLLLGISALNDETLITASKFFRNIQESGNVAYVVYENFPDSNNGRGSLSTRRSSGRLNTFAPPFMFGLPTYYYENVDEQPSTESVMIVAMKSEELFKNHRKPNMVDLRPPPKN